mgnify:CR=1 FL=1
MTIPHLLNILLQRLQRLTIILLFYCLKIKRNTKKHDRKTIIARLNHYNSYASYSIIYNYFLTNQAYRYNGSRSVYSLLLLLILYKTIKRFHKNTNFGYIWVHLWINCSLWLSSALSVPDFVVYMIKQVIHNGPIQLHRRLGQDNHWK